MHPMSGKSPEERKAIAVKSVESRRRNKEAAKQAAELIRQEAILRSCGLQSQIAELERKLARLQRQEIFSSKAAELTKKYLLNEDEIVAASAPWGSQIGVYFLIKSGQVVYVGQSVNVHARIASHTDKDFDAFAYVPCEQHMLDKLESLYIHCLRPPLNGNYGKAKAAPLALDALLSIR